MTNWMWCPKGSTGLMNIIKASKALLPLRRLRETSKLKKGDVVVCWGSWFGLDIEEVRVLNNTQPLNKLQELQALLAGDVLVPPFGLKPRKGWLPRRLNHQEATDFSNPPSSPGFYVKKLEVAREWRIHIVNGKSWRVGEKRPRPEVEHHEWVRGYSTGWSYYYDIPARESLPKGARELAKKAVSVLGLAIGAVDLWQLKTGELVVGEVNRRPGAEGNTATTYAKAIKEMIENG